MEVKLEKNGDLVIRIKTQNPPVPSATGKNLVVASTYGPAVSSCLIDGKPVTVVMTAYIRK